LLSYLNIGFTSVFDFLKMLKKILLYLLACGLWGCNDQPAPITELTEAIPASTQRTGDAARGREYLLYGDYVDSGIPYSIYLSAGGRDESNRLGRIGDNAVVQTNYTALNAPNGVRVVSTNCLGCHTNYINNQLVMGMGNIYADFTEDRAGVVPLLDLAINNRYGANSAERAAYANFRRGIVTLGPQTLTSTVGTNPADKYAAILGAHRNPDDLTWRDQPAYQVPSETITTDVPPLWNVRKKNALFYTGAGRGDFARLVMASSLFTLNNAAKAQEVDTRFPDLVQYLRTLEAPVYQGAVETALVSQGKTIFVQNCARCHGSYNDGTEAYPNLLVDLQTVKTDPTLSESGYAFPQFLDWYNKSWFSKGAHSARLQRTNGYVAPPLDGIWATAPYLHNGSVPTLAELLESGKRPKFWKKTREQYVFDAQKVGLNYTTETRKTDKFTYDTSQRGNGNGGHTFGDALSESERKALLEFLKTI
jgi:cytochrome c5